MVQYPHILEIKDYGDLDPNEDGFPVIQYGPDGFPIEVPVEGESSGDLKPTIHLECREVPNNAGSFVNTEAGEKTIYTSKVFMPLSVPDILNSTEVTIFEKDGVKKRISGRVIRFARYQLNCVLWV